MVPDSSLYNAAAAACSRASEWEPALQVLRDLGASKLQRNSLAVAPVLEAAAKSGKSHLVCELLVELELSLVLNVECGLR